MFTFLLFYLAGSQISIRLVLGFGFEQAGASCGSNEYCPAGWSILRRPADYSAQTCNPAVKERSKCPKPYMCVAAKCGISFCCASDKMLTKMREQDSEQREMEEEDSNEKQTGANKKVGAEAEETANEAGKEQEEEDRNSDL